MTRIILNYPRNEAQRMVIKAFEQTDGISEIEKGSYQVVGKTGISFPRVLWSYGEKVYVDISESGEENQTPIEVSGEKNVPINIGSNPDKFKRRFLDELEQLR